jgi:uncharacterized protein (DUF1501 family)
MTLDRRMFLARTGALALLSAGGLLGLDGAPSASAAAIVEALALTPPLPKGTPILVLIDLQGGNDATNMLINPSDPWYYDVAQGHGAVAIPEVDLLDLAGTSYALHPSMPWTASRFATNGDVAFVRGPGENVVHEFSHFAAMHYRQVATFTGSVATGWLGRCNDLVAPNNPFASISTVGVHPALVGANTSVLSVPNIQYFDFNVGWQWQDSWLSSWQKMSAAGWPAGTPTRDAEQSLLDTFEAQATVFDAWNSTMNATFDSNDVAQQLAQIAMLVAADVPCATYVVTYGGFDTHGSEAQAEPTLFSQLDAALGEFFTAVEGTSRGQDVFVFMSSEFGRQQTINASLGCDHGQAGNDILIGPRVKGGLYGETPDTAPAARLDDALVPTVDFRSEYATILNHLTGNTTVSRDVLFGTYEDLGIFS